jgi:DNA polymerase-4
MRKIIHVDMDCFYAAVEIRDNPSLKGKPVAVGGSPDSRGVIATANYEARKYGVDSAMASSQAVKKCPELTLLSPNFDKYRTESDAIRTIFHDYTDRIEPLSLDEAYLDVTEVERCEGSATKIAREIRSRIQTDRELTASAGVGPNKFLAKVASDWNKPDGQKTIAPGDVSAFMTNLAVEKIPGVGSSTRETLHEHDIHTCGDLQEYSRRELVDTFGKWGLNLFRLCRGRDDRPVSTDRERKSLSVERTFSEDLSSLDEVQAALDKLYEKFTRRWDNAEPADERINGIQVKVKYADFDQVTRERKRTGVPERDAFAVLVRQLWTNDERNVRLIGIGVKLCSRREGRYRLAQQSLFQQGNS